MIMWGKLNRFQFQ